MVVLPIRRYTSYSFPFLKEQNVTRSIPLILFMGTPLIAATNSLQQTVNDSFGFIVNILANYLFFLPVPIPFTSSSIPLILLILALGGILFTVIYGFINLRLFGHAWQVIGGKYDNPADKGEITHFQALTSALSATVGLGNIAGVAIAISAGGPGAVFWMWIVAFFGMSMKFSSCTFAQLFRKIDEKGRVLGGPMVYLEEGLKQRFPSFPLIGTVFGIAFAICTVIGSLGGGNLFQANQTYNLIASQIEPLRGFAGKLLVGTIMAFLVGIVILGGIKRIGEVTSKLVPTMCIFYVLSCLLIIISNATEVPQLFAQIFKQAFQPEAAFGGFLGVLINGIKRASFSNEAGLGSAAIAHSAAKTNEPVREGVVAMIGPFIDTHLVCTMTALAILITGAHIDPEVAGEGVRITARAFSSLGSFMPIALIFAVVVFAYSTAISWSYYGERAIQYLFGRNKSIYIYRIVFVAAIVVAPLVTLDNVIAFSDLAILSMSFPNIIGMLFLFPIVKKLADSYVQRLRNGEMKKYS